MFKFFLFILDKNDVNFLCELEQQLWFPLKQTSDILLPKRLNYFLYILKRRQVNLFTI